MPPAASPPSEMLRREVLRALERLALLVDDAHPPSSVSLIIPLDASGRPLRVVWRAEGRTA